jgi:hypothetical protein
MRTWGLYLEAPEFSEATFSPRRMDGAIAATGDSIVQVEGVFTLDGAPHDLTLPMRIHVDGANRTAKTRFTIPYVKWGLKDPSTFLLRVDKEVDMETTLAGQLSELRKSNEERRNHPLSGVNSSSRPSSSGKIVIFTPASDSTIQSAAAS